MKLQLRFDVTNPTGDEKSNKNCKQKRIEVQRKEFYVLWRKDLLLYELNMNMIIILLYHY